MFLPNATDVIAVDLERDEIICSLRAPEQWRALYKALTDADGCETGDALFSDCYPNAMQQLAGYQPIPEVPSALLLAMRCIGHALQRLFRDHPDGDMFRDGEEYGTLGCSKDAEIASSIESLEAFFDRYFVDGSAFQSGVQVALRLAVDGRFDDARDLLRGMREILKSPA